MHGGWGDVEVALHVCFGWRSLVDFRVRINERKILTLFFRERGYELLWDRHAGLAVIDYLQN